MEKQELMALFIIKLFAGFLIGWVSANYYPVNDYWDLNYKSIEDFHLLLNHPRSFFSDLFYNPYQGNFGRFFNAVGSYWNDLRNNIIIKILAILNIVSHGSYYINSMLLNSFGFIGLTALYRVYKDVYPQYKTRLMIGCFLLPSTLYFTSGIHKDLFVATFLAFFVYSIYFIVQKGFSWKRLGLMVFSTLMLLILRNFLFIILIPATISYFISAKFNINPLKISALILFSILIVLGSIELLFKNFHPLEIITQRQYDFLTLEKAGSQLQMNELKPTFKSFIVNFPQAVNHAFLRPYYWDSSNKFSFLLSIELTGYLLLLILFLFRFQMKININSNIVVFGIIVSMYMFLFIGYIIPNIGSIVRYRSIYIPFLITPIFSNVKFNLNTHYKH